MVSVSFFFRRLMGRASNKGLKLVRASMERAAKKRRMRAAALKAIEGKNPNQIAALIAKGGDKLLKSWEWKVLRQKVLDKYGRRCMKCGFIPERGQRINVDHIKPRMYFPELALEFDNLQVLCEPCNQEKGNKHCTDYRPTLGVTMSERKV